MVELVETNWISTSSISGRAKTGCRVARLGHDGRVDDAAFRDAADDIAVRYGLGSASGPLELAARGEQGVIWRLETPSGPYAVKELVMRQTDEEVAADVAFQERAAAGATSYDVASTLRTADGLVLSSVDGRQIRVQGWLEMAGPDPSVDPRLVGRMLAELHACGRGDDRNRRSLVHRDRRCQALAGVRRRAGPGLPRDRRTAGGGGAGARRVRGSGRRP